MAPQPVDENWHAFCQAIFHGVKGPESEAVCYRYKDLHRAVKSKKSEENKKAKVLRALKEANDRGVDFCDASREKELKTRVQVGSGPLGNPFEKPDGRIGHEQGERVPTGELKVLAPSPLPLI